MTPEKIIEDWNSLVPIGAEIAFSEHKDAEPERFRTTGLAFIEEGDAYVFLQDWRTSAIRQVRLTGRQRVVVG